jgi:ribonuclease J
MRYIIHRGAKEIGGSCIEVSTESTRVMLDMGFPLQLDNQPVSRIPDAADPSELLALGILPRIEGLYAWDEPRFDAVLLSHGHMDHYGLVRWLHPSIPVYLSRGTDAMISISQVFQLYPEFSNERRRFTLYEEFTIGDMLITPYLMDHSAVDAAAFAVKSEGQTLIYTGDFRGHGRKPSCLPAFLRVAPKTPDVLIIEGTMMSREKEEVLTERKLQDRIWTRLMIPEPVLFQCSSQNIDRLVSIYKACLESDRIFVVDLYTANVLSALVDLGFKVPDPLRYDGIRVFYPAAQTEWIHTKIGREYADKYRSRYISKAEVGQNAGKICMMVRPSIRADISYIPELWGGRLIYSMYQGYREQERQRFFEDFLTLRGFEIESIHTSGHAHIADLKRMIDEFEPRCLVPVHGFSPSTFKKISDHVQLVEDGKEYACLNV